MMLRLYFLLNQSSLKAFSVNDQTINDIFSFADDLHEMKIDEQDILVSYDVSTLFTNVPVDETIEILAEKPDLVELLEIATKNQLFQFEGNLYEQGDGVAMGSPLGPLMANAFMCNIEEKLKNQNKMPAFYISDMSTTLSAKCPMFHLPLNSC